MRKAVLFGLLISLLATGAAWAGGYNYVEPDEFKKWLDGNKKMTIVDIQPAPEFLKQHFRGSIETNSYPVKSDEERARLDRALPAINASADAVVVVCPRGGGGAKGAYDYFKVKGVDEKRLFILEKGMQGWPHKGLTVSGN